jgi:hypothetical protein
MYSGDNESWGSFLEKPGLEWSLSILLDSKYILVSYGCTLIFQIDRQIVS